FDRIVVTVGCPDLSPRWEEQLSPGGRIVLPLEHAGLHPLVALERREDSLEGRFVSWAAFIPARGILEQKLPWPEARSGPEEMRAEHERPVWAGFGRGEPIAGWGVPRDLMDFFLFLALSDPRAFTGPAPPGPIDPTRSGVGLMDRRGWVLASPDGIRAAGDPALLEELSELYSRWEVAGRPALEDWELSFAARSSVEARDGLVTERANYVERARLNG
ncbi:MAG TPA: hypothetical protein VF984_10270, partial [Actinomycetota bacterium]